MREDTSTESDDRSELTQGIIDPVAERRVIRREVEFDFLLPRRDGKAFFLVICHLFTARAGSSNFYSLHGTDGVLRISARIVQEFNSIGTFALSSIRTHRSSRSSSFSVLAFISYWPIYISHLPVHIFLCHVNPSMRLHVTSTRLCIFISHLLVSSSPFHHHQSPLTNPFACPVIGQIRFYC